jgi:hypothetical protein
MSAATWLLTCCKPFSGCAAAAPIILLGPSNAAAASAAIFRLCICNLVSSTPSIKQPPSATEVHRFPRAPYQGVPTSGDVKCSHQLQLAIDYPPPTFCD